MDWIHNEDLVGHLHRDVSYDASLPPPAFQIIYGNHALQGNVSRPRFVEGVQARKVDVVKVWEIVEKETDVNLALTMYRDVVKGHAQQVVLISNDSDARPARVPCARIFRTW